MGLFQLLMLSHSCLPCRWPQDGRGIPDWKGRATQYSAMPIDATSQKEDTGHQKQEEETGWELRTPSLPTPLSTLAINPCLYYTNMCMALLALPHFFTCLSRKSWKAAGVIASFPMGSGKPSHVQAEEVAQQQTRLLVLCWGSSVTDRLTSCPQLDCVM